MALDAGVWYDVSGWRRFLDGELLSVEKSNRLQMTFKLLCRERSVERQGTEERRVARGRSFLIGAFTRSL